MARVNIEQIVECLDSKFKRALEDTFREFAPSAVKLHSTATFKFFVKRVYHHCSDWESVPDSAVEI